jgi:hypothetical protein
MLIRFLPGRSHGRHMLAITREFWGNEDEDEVGKLPASDAEEQDSAGEPDAGDAEPLDDEPIALLPATRTLEELPEAPDEPRPHFEPEPVNPWKAAPRSETANPYGIGASVLADMSSKGLVIYGHLPARPATGEEQAEYKTRYGNPDWADLYPAQAPQDTTHDSDPEAA